MQRTSPQRPILTPLGHRWPLFAAMHGPDLLYLSRDLWPWGAPMRRRDFITLLGGALADRAIPANAQEPVRVRTVRALMGFANDAEVKARVDAFEQGLERDGWSVGHDLRIEYRYAEGDSARMQALAQELVELKPDCVLGQSTPVTAALMRATRTIPIVFVAVPIRLVVSLSRAWRDRAATLPAARSCTRASQGNISRC